ncbi:MAG: sulfotransferase [Phycisphaeraceae bacterium]
MSSAIPSDLADALGDPMRLVTIIGRGHSGTRAISHTLSRSGVYMGIPQNSAGDLLPPDDIYEACRVIAKHVEYVGELRWDFSKLHTMVIDPAFTRLITSYLASVIDSPGGRDGWRGWKIPETTLCYPWIVRLLPDARYIHWVRDPRDCILGQHLTDDMTRFGVPVPEAGDESERRAISYLYQAQIMRDTPAPANVVKVRFEDFVLDHPRTLARVGAMLGIELRAVPVRPEAVGRWRTNPEHRELDILQPELERLGYLEAAENER